MNLIMKLFRLLLLMLLCPNPLFAQLSDFDLQLEKTDETCLGNGTITIEVSNVTPSATMLYKVYKLPNVTTPVSVTTNTFVSSLTSGTYKVVAIQALGNQSNLKEQNITINNNVVPFDYSITSSNINCAAGGSITINATSGVAAQYEIIAGPVTMPLQTSNTFDMLPGGNYHIRVYNNCGVAKVKAFTLSLENSVLTIGNTYYSETSNIVCDSITVNNLVSPTAGSISYPVSVEYELSPMSLSGEVIIINQTYETGDADSLVVSAVVPRYTTESYTYQLRVTDNCNTSYEKADNVVDPAIEVALDKAPLLCAQRYLKVSAFKHIAPFTVEFLEAPTGFTASAFNPAGAGPFFEDVVEYGNEEFPIPFGNYIVKITDACGRVAQDTLLVEFEPLQPNAVGRNNGCFSLFGKITINVSQQQLVSATIIAAPEAYTTALPHDVSSFINGNGVLNITNVPIGLYTINITDNCGFTYTVDVEVPPFVEKDFSITTLPDCTPGYGTVQMKSGNGDLTSVAITAAPSAFSQPLPFDVSANISIEDGDLYMNNLPEGTYTFTAIDICGIQKSKTIAVTGYIPPQDSIDFSPNCGSFSVKVTDQGNGIHQGSYWLQIYDPLTGSWKHPNPNSEEVYEEGTEPNTLNSIKLTNNIQRNNLNYSGLFRIIKKFEAFNNGTAEKAICISVLGEFTYNDVFTLSNAYTLACTGSPNDVYIEAQGYNITYRIEMKDGEPFVIDNGPNNVFSNLEPATYIFSIEDACGNKLTKEVNLRELPSIADATQPMDMHICVEQGTADTNTFHLTEQNAAILGDLPSAMYTITYHLTQQDADNGVNPLPEYYTNTYNGQVIYARLVNNHITLCHGTTMFKLFVGEYPQAEITTTGTLCNDEMLALTASAGFDNYLWSTGETTRTIFVTQPGVYTVLVEKEYGTGVCPAVADVEVFASSTPSIVNIDTKDWTRNENSITVYAEGADEIEYSIDGVNYQDSNIFTDLETGVYQVYVRDAKGCGTDVKEIVLMHYPNFFTPNGDGINDKWRIKYSAKEPNLHVTIFDRYGKIITSFGATGEGWDGMYQGTALPSTDYWFVVKRQDGRELKGHFAMLR